MIKNLIIFAFSVAAFAQTEFTPPSGAAPKPWPGEYGPWNMRIMTAGSDDSLAWTRTNKIVSDRADVPSLAQAADGKIYLYYTGWFSDEKPNSRTCVAISSDEGKSWKFHKLKLVGFGRMAPPCDPTIVILADGTFRLFVTSEADDDGAPRSYCAEGSDGVNFTKKGVAFKVEGKDVLDPSVLKIGGVWRYFAGGRTPTPGGNWHATSDDGISFTAAGKGELLFVDKAGERNMMSNGVQVSEKLWRYYGFKAQRPHGINSWSTSDGEKWTLDAGARLKLDESVGFESLGVKDAAVVKLPSGKFLMAYVTAIPVRK